MTSEIRASDAERDRVAGELQQHGAAGRLTMEETSDRIGRAYQAATLGELGALTRDLPPLAASEHGPRPRRDPLAVATVSFAGVVALLALISVVTPGMCG